MPTLEEILRRAEQFRSNPENSSPEAKKRQRKERFKAAIRNLPQEYRRLGRETGDVLKSVARAFPRAAVATGASVGEAISEKILKRQLTTEEREVKPKSKFERFILGEDPVRTLSLQKERTRKFLTDVGVSPKASKIAATPLVFAGTLLDLIPGFGGAEKKVVQKAFTEIAASKEIPLIAKQLKLIGVKGDDISINKLAESLKEIDNPKQVEEIITSLKKEASRPPLTDDLVRSKLDDIKLRESELPLSARQEPPLQRLEVQNAERNLVPVSSEPTIPKFEPSVKSTDLAVGSQKAIGSNKIGRDLEAEIRENVLRYNRDKIADPEIARIRESNLLGKESIDEIITRKRGIVTDVEAVERAKDMKMTLDDVLNTPKETVPTKEQLTAVAQVVQDQREINSKLVQLINGGGIAQSAEERQLLRELDLSIGKMSEHELLNTALAESTRKLKKAEFIFLAMRGEAARTVQGMKQIIDGVDSRMKVLFNRIKNLPDLEQQGIIEQIAKTDIKNDKEFLKLLDKLSNADFFDKFAEYSTAAKLWNPTTHAVNFSGTGLRQIVDFGITSAVNITNPGLIKADIMGSMKGLGTGLRNALKALTNEGYAQQLSKYAETGGKDSAIKGLFGKFVRTPFRMLGASDEIFKTMSYQRSLYRQSYRMAQKEGLSGTALNKRMEELLNAPTFKMSDKAIEESKKLTFQEDMGDLIEKVNTFRNPSNFKSKTAKLGSLVFRFFVPFLKTPINLLKHAVDFTPLGIPKNFKAMKDAIKAGDTEKAAKMIGESVTGTLLAAYMTSEILEGNVTGGAPKEAKARDEFYREGKLPYAIKVGGKWYQYKRIDPFATIIGALADTMTLAKEDDVNAASLLNSFVSQMSDKTYLQGMSDFMTLFTGEEWEKENVLKNMLIGATLPSFIGHTARSIDPKVRDVTSIKENIQAQIPGLSQELPAKVNVLGYDIERANEGLNYFFNPIQSENAEIDPVTKELLKVDYQPPLPQRSFERKKVKYELDAKQYHDFAKFVGETIRNGVMDLKNKASYKNLSSEEKIKKIEKIRSEAMDEWKDNFIKGKTSPGQRRSIEEVLQGL